MGFLGPLLRRFNDARLVEFRRPPRRKEVSPSVSMYFADPLADLIDDDESFSGRPIQQLSPSLYVCGQTAIVIRHTNRHEIKILREGKFERIFLLIDDDFDCLGEADGLPADYRARLVKYREGPFRNLLELVTDVVAPSERILRSYRRQRKMLLEPAQCHKIVALDHHKASDMIDIVFAGTRAHVFDFEHVAPGFAEVLRRHSNVRLTTFLKGHVPKALRRLPNAVHMSPMGWQQYRRFVDSNKYHIAVAPRSRRPSTMRVPSANCTITLPLGRLASIRARPRSIRSFPTAVQGFFSATIPPTGETRSLISSKIAKKWSNWRGAGSCCLKPWGK